MNTEEEKTIDHNSPNEETAKSFQYQWEATAPDFEVSHLNPEFKEKIIGVFLDDVKLPAKWFKGKLCLDAGCGIGRWTYCLDKLGAKVVAFDITNSGVETTRRTVPNAKVMKADIFDMPFKEKSFDFILSWGVLHHTKGTRAALEKLLPLLKDDGIIFIMVYEKYNPIKLFNTDVIRKILHNFSDENIYKFCGFMARLGKIKPIRYIGSTLIQMNTSRHGLFDCYSTPINHHHTENEVCSWFWENGFTDITLTNSTTYSNPVLKFLRGKHRGTIRLRVKRGNANGNYNPFRRRGIMPETIVPLAEFSLDFIAWCSSGIYLLSHIGKRLIKIKYNS